MKILLDIDRVFTTQDLHELSTLLKGEKTK